MTAVLMSDGDYDGGFEAPGWSTLKKVAKFELHMARTG